MKVKTKIQKGLRKSFSISLTPVSRKEHKLLQEIADLPHTGLILELCMSGKNNDGNHWGYLGEFKHGKERK